MKIERLLLIAVVVGTVACHGNDKAVRKDQQYDVVQEGQATGVTSTINAPGETPAVTTPPITGTGADTTTAFNSTPGVMSTVGAPAGSLAGTLPPPMPNSPAPRTTSQQPMTSSSTAPPAPAPIQVIRPKRQPPTPHLEPMPPEPATTTDQAPPPTDTTATTSTTSTQPPATKTDTTSTEPPPPPPPPPAR